MPLNLHTLIEAAQPEATAEFAERERLLYALSLGFGSQPELTRELPYVAESVGQATVPTMAAMLAFPEFLRGCGWDYTQVLHGEQKLELFRPLPPYASLTLSNRVVALIDRGEGKGAILRVATDARLARDDTAMFTAESTLIARADGGFGGKTGTVPPPHAMPNRAPDLSCDLAVRPDQALLYRLNGDRNPLHSDPAVAKAAGFPRPILHGLCTYGIACRAVLRTICDYDFTLIGGFDVRFSAPVFPGDVVTTDMWQDGNLVSCRCVVKARNTVVLNHGRCVLTA